MGPEKTFLSDFDKFRVFLSFAPNIFSGSIDYVEIQYVVKIHLLFQPYKLFKVNIYKCFIEKSSFLGCVYSEKKLFSPVGHPPFHLGGC